MGDTESERKMVISLMKSIIVSVKGGLPFNKLDGDYREQNGQRIPYSKFGFRSLEDFVRSISEVKMLKVDGSTMLTVVDPKMAHIKSLLDRQRPVKKRIRPQKRGFHMRSNYGRTGARPVSKVGGGPPRTGGYPYRPAVSAPSAPRRPSPLRQEPQVPVKSTNGDRERGHGDGPRTEHNFYSRPLGNAYQNHTSDSNKRGTFQPEPVAYSNTHSIRQGKGFVEYIPLDNPRPPKSEVSSKQPPPKSEVSSRQPPPKSEVSYRQLPPKSEVSSKQLPPKSEVSSRQPPPKSEVTSRQPPPKSDVSVRQGKSVQYISPDNPPSPKSIIETKTGKGETHENGTVGKSSLSQKYSDFLRQIESERAASIKVNGHFEPDQNGHSSRQVGRARGVRKLEDAVGCESVQTRARSVDSHLGSSSNHVANGLKQQEPRDPSNRTVEYVERRGVDDGALTVTIANDFVSEDDDDWLDYDEDEQDEDSYMAYHKLLLRPKFRNHQLIGDDFLLHFANYIDEPCQEIDGWLSACGLCISGQTVSMCVNDIYETAILSERVILLVGAVDIVQGMDFSTLKLQLISLLTELVEKNIKRMYICTVPPLLHLSNAAAFVRVTLNKFIKSLESGTMYVIDLETEPFVDKNNQLCESYFEENEIQTVNPSLPSIALPMWNRRGLEVLRNVIQKGLA